jgi:hypothetical protein
VYWPTPLPIYWVHVPLTWQVYHGPFYLYAWDWYFWRHVSFPWLYAVYDYEPVVECVTYYYYFAPTGLYYCYITD